MAKVSKAGRRARRLARQAQSQNPRLPGRDRVNGKRATSGRLRPPTRKEREEDILKVGTSNPDRAGTEDPRSRYHGSLIGKLYITKQIDPVQFGAAERYAGLRARYLFAVGAPSETAKALDPSQDASARPLWSAVVTDEDQVQAIANTKASWADCMSALRDCSRIYHGAAGSGRVSEVIRLAVVDGVLADLGDLRCGLNVLARMWGMRKTGIW